MVDRLPGNRFAFTTLEMERIEKDGLERDDAKKALARAVLLPDARFSLTQRAIEAITDNSWNNDGDCVICNAPVWGGGNCTKGCVADSYNMAMLGKPGKPLSPRQALIECLGKDDDSFDAELQEREAEDAGGGAK